VSGSQLTHYFPDKESLVRAALAWRAESMMGLRDDPPRGPLDNMAALRAWADTYVGNPDVVAGGCSFGSLAAEVLKSDLDVSDAIAEGFARWRAQFRDGFTAMRNRGQLRPDADPDQLATSLMAPSKADFYSHKPHEMFNRCAKRSTPHSPTSRPTPSMAPTDVWGRTTQPPR